MASIVKVRTAIAKAVIPVMPDLALYVTKAVFDKYVTDSATSDTTTANALTTRFTALDTKTNSLVTQLGTVTGQIGDIVLNLQEVERINTDLSAKGYLTPVAVM